MNDVHFAVFLESFVYGVAHVFGNVLGAIDPLPQSPTTTMRALSLIGITGASVTNLCRPRKSRTPAASPALTHSGSVIQKTNLANSSTYSIAK
jgi:hypothetical protein